MKITAVRHAHTTYNRWWRLNGNPKIPVKLSSKGRKQAHDLAEKLKSEQFDHIVVSQMPRTRETADIINENHGCDVSVEPRFNDIDTGFEGLPVVWWWFRLRLSKDPVNAVFNKGESLKASHARVEEAIDDLQKLPYKSILVVAHRHTIHSFQEVFMGERGSAENADFHVFDTSKA